MEHLSFSFPAQQTPTGKVQVGIVSSGDMEVLFKANGSLTLMIHITTSVDNSFTRWLALFNRLSQLVPLPGGQLVIRDFGATPGVARLRIEQAFEEISYA